MTNNKTTFARALSGFLIILVLMASISLLGGFSSPSEGNNASDKEIEEYITIKAGTYVFDYTIMEFPEAKIPLEFTCSFTTDSGNEIYAEAKGINFYLNQNLSGYIVDIINFDFTVYEENGESSIDNYKTAFTRRHTDGSNEYDCNWGYNEYRKIHVPYDQRVPKASEEWFEKHTTYRIDEDNSDSGNENPGGDSGNTENEGSFGETPAYKENTIYAGTYRWNDKLTYSPDLSTTGSYNLPFALPNLIFDGVEYTVNGYAVAFFNENNDEEDWVLFYGVRATNGNSTQEIPAFVYANKEYFWSYGNVALSQLNVPIGYGQTITITADTEVDEAFANWFSENTQMLIKAGTYKWNDVPNTPISDKYHIIDIPIIFTSKTGITEAEEDVLLTEENFVKIQLGTYGEIFAIAYTHEQSGETQAYYRSPTYGWNYTKYLVSQNVPDFPNMELFDNLGQIITITEDKFVPADFGMWFVCNAAKWEAATSDTSEASATILNIPFNEVLYVPTNKDDLMCA